MFGIIKCDERVMTGDKIRIDCSESFLPPGVSFKSPISHEISMDNEVTWYNITAKKMVDWIFMTAADKTISLRLTDSTDAQEIFTKDIKILDLTLQKLFSNDSDLYALEPEIDAYLPKKWSSWNIVHLKSQEYIMDWLDEKRIFKSDGIKYVVDDLLDLQEVKQWSTYKTLEFIFEGNSNVVGDISSVKRDKYRELANEKSTKSQLALNVTGGATVEAPERIDLHTIRIFRG